MSQVTRALVIASTVLAAFAQTYVATFYWPPQTIWIASASVVVLAIAGYRLRAFALPAVLASIYFMPALLYVTRGGENVRARFSLDDAAARSTAIGTWRAPVVAAGAVAVAARHVGLHRLDHLADRVPA